MQNIIKPKEYKTDNNAATNQYVGKHFRYPNHRNRITEGGSRLNEHYKLGTPEHPLVTVITTVYNRCHVIEKAICSVLEQSYNNIEYIVIDAASNDGTLDKIIKYEDIIDYFISEPDKGMYEGMNKGLELANGNYIIILNSDDWYIPECIEILVNEAVTKSLDMVCALAIETDEFGNIIRHIPMQPFKDNVRFRMPLRHETMLISRELYNQIGPYDSSFKIIGDLKLSQQIFNNNCNFKQIDHYLMYFRKMGIASTLSKELIEERKRLLLEQFPFLSQIEVSLLANEYTKNLAEYYTLAKKYDMHSKFILSLTHFLKLNNAFKIGLPNYIFDYFSRYIE